MKILNSQGQPILLNSREKLVASVNQRAVNALGFEVDITTLTTIMKKITEQKFFQLAPADFMPVRVGEGAWSSNLLTYRSFSLADDFSTGVINTGSNNGRLAVGDAGVDSLSIKVHNWAKQIGWSIFDLELASKSGNWDLVTAKEKARKKNWDLGIQKVSFLGLAGDASALGLLTQAGVTTNAAVITKALKTMTATELKTFCNAILAAYRLNCANTAWPSHFVIPETDYLGLAGASNPDYPLKSVLEVLQDTFKIMTGNKSFEIRACAYCDGAVSGLGVQKYALYNGLDEESLRMDIPVDYTNTLANSVDNFSFQNVGYGQFTGVLAYRPAELMYFTF